MRGTGEMTISEFLCKAKHSYALGDLIKWLCAAHSKGALSNSSIHYSMKFSVGSHMKLKGASIQLHIQPGLDKHKQAGLDTAGPGHIQHVETAGPGETNPDHDFSSCRIFFLLYFKGGFLWLHVIATFL